MKKKKRAATAHNPRHGFEKNLTAEIMAKIYNQIYFI